MPVDTLEAAKLWRSARLDASLVKDSRIDGNPGTSRPEELVAEQEELDAETADQLDLDATDADVLFRNARAIKEKQFALQAKAEHDLFIGTLVKRDDVERGVSAISRQFRDGLINVCRRLAAEVAALSDAGECEKVIDREHKVLLDALSRGFAEKFK